MPRTVVFLGPTLPRDRARAILDADYLPPARHGDVYRLLTEDVSTIVLIDGVFHGEPSVWQREILSVLDEGIAVLGASSMGALRAAELHSFGMVGHGTVFEWYRDGLIDGDDEVALRHAPEELAYRGLSEPLVNIRATLEQATRTGSLQPAEAQALLEQARRTYYPERSYPGLLASAAVASWAPERVEALRRHFSEQPVDLKAQDAMGLLRLCAARGTVPRTPAQTRVDPWREEFLGANLATRVFETERGTLQGASLPARLRAAWEGLADVRRAVVTRWYINDFCRQRGASCPPEFERAFVDRWHAARGLHDPRAWARARGLTGVELGALLAERALFEWLLEQPPTRFALDWDAARAARADAAAGVQGDATAACHDAISRGYLLAWAQDHGVSVPAPPAEEAPPDDLLQRHELTAAEYLGHARDRARARWLVEAGPRHFGRRFDVELAVFQELLLAGRAAELLASERPHA